MMNWQAGFVAAAVAQALALGAALGRPAVHPHDRSLAVVLLVLAGMLVVYPLGWQGRAEVPTWLAFLPVNLPLALGPLLYLHVRQVAQAGRFRLRAHLVPAALQLAYLLTLSLLPGEASYAWKEAAHDSMVKPVLEWVVLLSMAGYAAAGLAVLRVYRRRLRAERSDADRHDARWLSLTLATLVAATAVLGAARTYTSFVGEIDGSVWFLWFSVWAVWLGVAGWRRAGMALPTLSVVASEDPSIARESSGDPRDWTERGASWEAQTRDGGWWRDPELTIATLARYLGTNTHYLSRAVNEGLGLNFNEMVNNLRVDEAARRLADGSDAKIIDIALDAGFSSKTTFNRTFHSRMGLSPSAYRRQAGGRDELPSRAPAPLIVPPSVPSPG